MLDDNKKPYDEKQDNKEYYDFFDDEPKNEDLNSKLNYETKKDFPTKMDNNIFTDKYSKYEKKYYDNNANPPIDNYSNKGKKIFWVSIISVLMVVVFFLGMVVNQMTDRDALLLKRMKDVINQYYIEDVNNEDLIIQAGKGMLGSLDPYSTFLGPTELYELMNPPQITEPVLGIQFYPEYPYYVYNVAIGSPAYKYGVFKNDIVESIQGVEITRDTSLAAFQKLLQSNETIALQLKRNEQSISVTISKATFDSSFVEYYFENNGEVITNMSNSYINYKKITSLDTATTGFIHITEFMTAGENDLITASKDFIAAMKLFKEAYNGRGKLVLDLKGNPGGRNDITATIAGYLMFDKNNPTAKTLPLTKMRNRDGVIEITQSDIVYNEYFDVTAETPQIITLTDGGSASASELLLGAMLDYGTTIHVGEKSYGKGISQTVIPILNVTIDYNGKKIDSAYAVYLTFARFFTPISDVCHHGDPFVPNDDNIKTTYNDIMVRAKTLLA